MWNHNRYRSSICVFDRISVVLCIPSLLVKSRFLSACLCHWLLPTLLFLLYIHVWLLFVCLPLCVTGHLKCIVFPGGERNCGVHELICIRKGRSTPHLTSLYHNHSHESLYNVWSCCRCRKSTCFTVYCLLLWSICLVLFVLLYQEKLGVSLCLSCVCSASSPWFFVCFCFVLEDNEERRF